MADAPGDLHRSHSGVSSAQQWAKPPVALKRKASDASTAAKQTKSKQRKSSSTAETKRCWSKEEDRLLLDLIEKHGPMNWSVIASSLSDVHGYRSGA